MKVRFCTATLTALCVAIFDLSIPLIAQPITTDISSVPVLARLACRERASREFNISLGSVAMLGLKLDRSANRTLVVGNSGDSKQTAFCTVNPNTARVTAFALTDLGSGDTGGGSGGGQSEQEDVLKFQTSTYAVRVYRESSGRALMNVYNRGTGQMALSNAPAVSSAGSGYKEYYSCSTNREPCDGRKYTARIDDSGKRSLNIQTNPNTTGVTEFETR